MATIFIVDDDLMISRPLGLLLNLIGHRTVCFTDAAELLPALHAGGTPEVVLLDLTMPGVDGLAVLSSIRNDPDRELAATPILIWSAMCDPHCIAQAAAAGANDYIIKGISFDDLQKRLAPFLSDRMPSTGCLPTKQLTRHARSMLRERTKVLLPVVAGAVAAGPPPARRPRAKPAAPRPARL